MSEFRNRVLSGLDRIYGFLSAKHSTNRLELNQPVQLVHDVSREAELQSNQFPEQSGWFYAIIECACAGASTYRESTTPYGLLDVTADFVEDYLIWLYQVSAYVPYNDASDVSSVAVSVGTPPSRNWLYHGNTYPVYIPVFYNDGTYHQLGPTGLRKDGLINILSLSPLPVPLPYLTTIDAVITTTAALGAPGLVVSLMFWVGKKGQTPPGLR